MGIPELWKALAPASVPTSLKKLTTDEAMKRISLTGPASVYRVGVDASIWFGQMQHTFGRGKFNSGSCPELRTLFFRLCHYLNMPIHLVFVLDGTDRPDQKRGSKVLKGEHWMVKEAKELVTAFGFECHQAPGEAEAELAKMNSLGLIDAVLTEDSDAFVFGAHNLIRNPNFSKTGDEVQVYRRSEFQRHKRIAHLRNVNCLVLFALLCGCDYNMIGLQNCARETALGLTKYSQLYDRLDDLAIGDKEKLSQWRTELQSILADDPRKFMDRHHLKLSQSIPSDFPDPGVIKYLMTPIRSSDEALKSWYQHSASTYSGASLKDLYRFCRDRLHWDDFTMSSKFESLVWPGLVLRMVLDRLVKDAEAYKGVDPFIQPIRASLDSLPVKGRRLVDGICHSPLELDTTEMVKLSLSEFHCIFQAFPKPPSSSEPVSRIKVLIPYDIISEVRQVFLNTLLDGEILTTHPVVHTWAARKHSRSESPEPQRAGASTSGLQPPLDLVEAESDPEFDKACLHFERSWKRPRTEPGTSQTEPSVARMDSKKESVRASSVIDLTSDDNDNTFAPKATTVRSSTLDVTYDGPASFEVIDLTGSD